MLFCNTESGSDYGTVDRIGGPSVSGVRLHGEMQLGQGRVPGVKHMGKHIDPSDEKRLNPYVQFVLLADPLMDKQMRRGIHVAHHAYLNSEGSPRRSTWWHEYACGKQEHLE